jgi:hypothetical protein
MFMESNSPATADKARLIPCGAELLLRLEFAGDAGAQRK